MAEKDSNLRYEDTIWFKFSDKLKKFTSHIKKNRLQSLGIFLMFSSFIFFLIGVVRIIKNDNNIDDLVATLFLIIMYIISIVILVGKNIIAFYNFFKLEKWIVRNFVIYQIFGQNIAMGTIYLLYDSNELPFNSFYLWFPLIVVGCIMGLIILCFIGYGFFLLFNKCYVECYKIPHTAYKNEKKNKEKNINLV